MSDKRVFRYYLKFIIPVAISFSLIIVAFSFQLIPRNGDRVSPSSGEEFTYDELSASNSFLPNILGFFCLLLLILGILILIECTFFWTPSLTGFVSIDKKGKMLWRKSRFWVPERCLNLKLENASISVHRKQFSLNGLLMRKFIAKIHLPKDTPEIKRISDFIGVEKMVQTPTAYLLIKSVDLRYLPLQIIQIQSLLAILHNQGGYKRSEGIKA
ncbi:MAG: hypothetical protein ACFFAJ_01935 [Candidatus Hodarchaeota archaeon]